MTHAARFCRQDGAIFLLAECREGVGSQGYLNYMKNLPSPQQVIDEFSSEGFSVGPHKAYQVARILEKCKVFLRSSMDDRLVRSLLMNPLPHQNDLTDLIQVFLPDTKRIAILPYATACIPALPGGSNE